MKIETIGIIGLGLIGGSLAKTIRRKQPELTLIGYDSDSSSILDAMNDGIINFAAKEVGSDFAKCDLLFLCAPVSVNLKLLSQLKEILPKECLITDVSSMKSKIQEEAKQLGIESHFIGGHPMAGLESIGYSSSNAYLFENVYYIITPDPSVPEDIVDGFTTFLKSIDVIPIQMTASEHDFAVANVSHVPHIISAALVNLVHHNDTEKEGMKRIAAGGFKDITRISSSSPDMWSQISKGNKEFILPVLDQYIDTLKKIRAELKEDCSEEIHDFFSDAKDYRDSITNRTGAAYRQNYRLYCDLIDEAGEIATIATRLSTHHISIRNIGIVHNREFEEGVLCIEFYDARALEEATDLLKRFRYHIYERN